MSIEHEQSLIGGLMKIASCESDIASYILSTLKPASFSALVNKEIYKGLLFLNANKMYFDNLSVMKQLDKNDFVEIRDIDLCYQYAADASLLRQYSTAIKDESMERFSVAKIADIQDMITNPENGNIAQRLGLAESVISGLIEQMQNREEKGLRDAGYWAGEWIDDKEAYHRGEQVSYTLGIQGIDEAFKPKGVLPGSLVVVGARPKMGKTFTAVKIIDHFLKESGKAVCAFSMEMRGVDIWERAMSSRGRVDSDSFYSVSMENTGFWDHAGGINVELANSQFYLDDSPCVSMAKIKKEVREVHRKNPVGLVMVDYLTLMGTEEAERNDLKYANITKELKILAKELGCVILLLIQLNRGLENRPDKRPVPSDGRDTGQIEQDCDVWIGLYRESVYNADCGHTLTEAIVRLNRAGSNATAYMELNNGYFEDINQLDAHRQVETVKEEKRKQEQADDEQSTFKGRGKRARL